MIVNEDVKIIEEPKKIEKNRFWNFKYSKRKE